MRKYWKFCMVSVFGFLMFSFLIQTAQALPAFARKFQTSCSTCHVSAPKLTAFGESYRLNGKKYGPTLSGLEPYPDHSPSPPGFYLMLLNLLKEKTKR
jgi:hypothetical protein